MTTASARLADKAIKCPDCGGPLFASRFDVTDDEAGDVFGLPARLCVLCPRIWMTAEIIDFHGLTEITYAIEEDASWVDRHRGDNGYIAGLAQWQEADAETRRRLTDVREGRL